MHMSDVETGNIALILINWITNKNFLKSFGRMKKKDTDNGSKLEYLSTYGASTWIYTCM